MRVIGLTGGIATGKSTVSRMLAEKGLPIVDAISLPGRWWSRASLPTGKLSKPSAGKFYRPMAP